MRKGILVLLLVLFLVPTSSATLTKLYTMGQSFLYMKDDYNIWYFPQTAVDYQKHVIAEHPYAGTVVMKLGENDALGIRVMDYSQDYFVIPYYDVPYYYGFNGDMFTAVIYNMYYSYYNSYTDDGVYLDAQDKFSLVYAHKFETFKLGLMANLLGASLKVDDSESDPAETFELKTGIMNFVGGFSMDIGEGHELDLAVNYSHASFKWDDNTADPSTIVEPDGGNAFGVTARFMYKYNDQVTLVPAINFFTGGIGIKSDYFYEAKTSRTILDIGLGCNYKPSDKFELISALGTIYDKKKYDYSEADDMEDFSSFDMPYFLMGMDLNVKSWLNFRLGVNKFLSSWKFVDDEGEYAGEVTTKWSEAPFMYTLGAGIMLGDLQFDCQVNEDFLNNGPYWVSGYSTYMFPMVSIKYNFK